MANARTLKRSFNIAQLGLSPSSATTGAWTTQLSSGLVSLHKAAAGTTSVLNIPIPNGPKGGIPYCEDAQISIVELFYLVSTANLTSAPTIVMNRHTMPGGAGTGFVAITATPAATLTFAGVDTVGTAFGAGAAGSHILVATFPTPYNLIDTDALVMTVTMNEGATSVLDIYGISVTYI